jgi:hypothetical protein
MPNEYFDPNGKIGLQPNLKLGLNGYTLNEANVLNDVNDKMFDIADQLREANATQDNEKIAYLQNIQYSLDEIKGMVAAGEYDERDLLFAANKAGIKKIKEDWIIPADNSDLANIRNITGGLDLNDKKNWSNEMKMIDEAYAKKYQQAQAAGFKSQQVTSPKGKTKKNSQYKLSDLPPSGEGKIWVIAPNGKPAKIPIGSKNDAIADGASIIE